ncbi:MAG: sensor domain-containing diguanylate cyclase, partial [Defluviitaleaceae bacterium]|nr:sensor domain-containing diguanylate cyclase [Defluviitaleaceae bacterium]
MRSAAFLCANTVIMNEHTDNIKKTTDKLAQREKMLKAINEMAVALISREDSEYDNVLSTGLKPISGAAGVDQISIFKMSSKDGLLGQVYLWHGETVPVDEKLKVVQLDPPVKRWLEVLTTGKCINADVTELPDDEAEWLTSFGIKAVYFVPVYTHGNFWGVITLEDHTAYRRFDDDCLDLLQSAAHLCADVVAHADLEREAAEKNKLLNYDALTNIYNRRYFDENIETIIKTLSRSKGHLSLIMIDIDRFKNYNDTYGHYEGDQCLIKIAETLTKCITRTDDFIARYGGEEFIAVLPNTDENGACLLAEKLMESIRSCKIEHKTSDVNKYVTISIGVTTGTVSHLQQGHDYIKRADEMLYLSKQQGRNRYMFGSL